MNIVTCHRKKYHVVERGRHGLRWGFPISHRIEVYRRVDCLMCRTDTYDQSSVRGSTPFLVYIYYTYAVIKMLICCVDFV